jgi:tRNA dimethylallyltransferase
LAEAFPVSGGTAARDHESLEGIKRHVDIIYLIGATGVGKSELGLQLARVRSAVVLSLDSMQVYRGLDIGTGKPTLEEQTEIRHGGLDWADPGQPFSVAQYLERAQEFFSQHSRVMVIGGTGLYFRALTQGLCEAPASAPERQSELSGWSLETLQTRLREIDPAYWEKVDRANPRRLIRAIQVMEETGLSLGEWQTKNRPPVTPHFRAIWLQRDPEDHQQKIRNRVKTMFDQGWVGEVERLLDRHGAEVLRRCKAIGYSQIAEALLAKREPQMEQESIVTATWQYARRQLTWFRKEVNLTPLNLSSLSSSRSADALASLLSAA